MCASNVVVFPKTVPKRDGETRRGRRDIADALHAMKNHFRRKRKRNFAACIENRAPLPRARKRKFYSQKYIVLQIEQE